MRLGHRHVCGGLSSWLVDAGRSRPLWVAPFPSQDAELHKTEARTANNTVHLVLFALVCD